MKRRYELNLYTPDQYNDLQEHLGHMASRGWMLERMEQHFLVYRQNVSSPVHYAVAFHPEVGDMDSLRTPALEFYEDLCRQAQWRLVDTWSKYPQIQVYATRQRDPVPLQTDLATHWAVMEDWMEKRYWPKVQGDTAFGSLANLLLAAFALLWVVQGELSILQKILLIGLCSLLMIQVIRHFSPWSTSSSGWKGPAGPERPGARTSGAAILVVLGTHQTAADAGGGRVVAVPALSGLEQSGPAGRFFSAASGKCPECLAVRKAASASALAGNLRTPQL